MQNPRLRVDNVALEPVLGFMVLGHNEFVSDFLADRSITAGAGALAEDDLPELPLAGTEIAGTAQQVVFPHPVEGFAVLVGQSWLAAFEVLPPGHQRAVVVGAEKVRLSPQPVLRCPPWFVTEKVQRRVAGCPIHGANDELAWSAHCAMPRANRSSYRASRSRTELSRCAGEGGCDHKSNCWPQGQP